MVVNSLSIAQGGLLDLANNDMIVRSASGGSVATWLAEGFNYGGTAWAGPTGIISSSAAAANRLMALGIVTNGANGNAVQSTFDGQPVYAGDMLVKYTYIGDANLDGKVDGSDYSLIDGTYTSERGANVSLSGWAMGDFNFDGVVDGSDYALIDNAFNNQGSPIPAVTAAQPANTAASPVMAIPAAAVAAPAQAAAAESAPAAPKLNPAGRPRNRTASATFSTSVIAPPPAKNSSIVIEKWWQQIENQKLVTVRHGSKRADDLRSGRSSTFDRLSQ
jgi:hypothetical protein